MYVKFCSTLQLFSCIHFVFAGSSIPRSNLYRPSEQYDCLYYDVTPDIISEDEPLGISHQIIPYCLNSTQDIHEENSSIDECDENNTCWTFAQLKEKDISSEEVLAWSVPIDLVERYQIYLTNPNVPYSESLTVIYNCTEGWFGSRCQYTFDAIGFTFADIVYRIFRVKPHLWDGENPRNSSCYTHISCDRGPSPSCLDWREICDGKIDCINGGIDEEQQCMELEASECEKDEYRCRNGECIHHAFFQDNVYDCADRTDEKFDFSDRTCVSDPSFLCEERICPRWDYFACGDGDCLAGMIIMFGSGKVCADGRDQRMIEAILSYENNLHLSLDCYFAMMCFTDAMNVLYEESCNRLCINTSDCFGLLQALRCPSPWFFFPAYPVVHGHVRLAYHTNVTDFTGDTLFTPYLICFDSHLCNLFSNSSIRFNGSSCHYYSDLDISNHNYSAWTRLVNAVENLFLRCSLTRDYDCSNLFQCENSSRCISKHRLLDDTFDCFDNSDEKFRNTCSFNHSHRFQCSSDPTVCILLTLVNDGILHCPSGEDEIKPAVLPLFSMLCNWYEDIFPRVINGRNESDETDCGSYFPCNNQYTQCNGIWDCPNGIDEADCQSPECSAFHHPCVSLVNNSIECLPVALAGDGIVHCRGGTDERHYCRDLFPTVGNRRYRCSNRSEKCIPLTALCGYINIYRLEDDEWCDEDDDVICPLPYFQNESTFKGICWDAWDEQRSQIEALLCNLHDQYIQTDIEDRPPKRFLTLRHAGYFPARMAEHMQQENTTIVDDNNLLAMHRPMNFFDRCWLCNRGILVFRGAHKEIRCLCPPAYYGDRCQYQNQRISLILQFVKKISPDRSTVFQLLIMLLDEVGTIESYDYITYVPEHDCSIRFRLNLLYSSRPKDPKKNYTIRIDAFNSKDLSYHSSWHLPIRFSNLPVYHSAARLFIGSRRLAEDSHYCTIGCGPHGQCIKYENTLKYFCRCLEGWSGYRCNITHTCQCSKDSICAGVINNRSICICPLNKYGRFCHLTQTACQPNTCNSRGVCIANDDRIAKDGFICLCNEGYFGSQCEFLDTKIVISFADDIPVPPAIFAHFIVAVDDAPHVRTTIFKKIAFDQDMVTLYRSSPFHILFVEFLDNYYMTVVQEEYHPSMVISTSVLSSHRCPPVSLLFNETIVNFNHLHRMKLYHIPCQERSQLMCFYDELLMCLCNLDRQANCFEFNHNMTYDCQGTDYCKNDGQCFQDDPTCPVTSICVCPECYFGTHCQFTTKSFHLSLDFILGYQIHPNVSFSRQTKTLKICLALTILMLVIGLIDGYLSIITFKSKKLREIGCGNYLLFSSIICLFHINLFALEFLFLVLSQMGIANNRSFLSASCKSMNFLLKVLPNIRDWLYACIAIERAVTITKGVNFDKTMSNRASKVIIPLVTLFVIGTSIDDPIYRRLIDDNGEGRIWCVTDYPRSMEIYHSIMDISHFCVPFCINIICALSIIVIAARTRSTARKNQTYEQHLIEQFQEHKHLLISPFILTLLALPRLIVSFLSGCMKSARNPWAFILSYFISLISSASIFVVFILPSKTYTTEFTESIRNTFIHLRRSR